jgi:hypothetical protein
MITVKNTKQNILEEIQLFFLYASFLALFFCSLTTYKRLILGEYSISYFHYGSGVVQALILSKVIILGEHFHFGEKFENKPLIIPTLYKTIIFCVLFFILAIIEHFILGYFKDLTIAKIYHEFFKNGIDEILAKILLVFFVFILFFAFIEISRVLGKGKLLQWFLKRKDPHF